MTKSKIKAFIADYRKICIKHGIELASEDNADMFLEKIKQKSFDGFLKRLLSEYGIKGVKIL